MAATIEEVEDRFINQWSNMVDAWGLNTDSMTQDPWDYVHITTWNLLPFLLHRVGAAPGWVAWLWTGGLLLWSCWTLSAPGMEESVPFLYVAWVVTGAVWSVRAVVALGILARRRRSAQIRWRGFVVQPVIVAIVWALASSNGPLEARFARGCRR